VQMQARVWLTSKQVRRWMQEMSSRPATMPEPM
jgi:hypothetical protein